jgi:hypothetical protein
MIIEANNLRFDQGQKPLPAPTINAVIEWGARLPNLADIVAKVFLG